ncbi:MAG: MFS transporter [Myxococcales bacterium]
MGALIEIVDASVVNVALSHIQASYGATLTQVSWVVSGYSIANVIVLPLAAWIGQRIGKKHWFLQSNASTRREHRRCPAGYHHLESPSRSSWSSGRMVEPGKARCC